MVALRLFGIPARDAPVVAVVRRGPSAWSHLGRWDLTDGSFEPGAWIRANLSPQRCDVSPDGRWFSYFAAKTSARWDAGPTYIAISRLPWLAALAAWATCGTWTRGAHFVDDPGVQELGVPDEGDLGDLNRALGLAFNRATTFAVERRRGWAEAPGTPPRVDGDMWDELRADRVVMEKTGGDDARLTARGRYAAFRDGPFRGEPRVVAYGIGPVGAEAVLPGVQWADWDQDGRLLVATHDGRLQVRARGADGSFLVAHEVDVAPLRPDPQRAPLAARAW
jgi:hypothetical protein